MPRRSGARTSSPARSAPAPAPAPRRPAPPPPQRTAAPMPPAPAAAAPPPAAGGGMMSGLMGSMAQGMAMGTGMSMANRAVDAVMGPRQTEVVHKHEGGQAPPPAQDQKCFDERAWVKQCFDQGGTQESCQFYSDLLKQCQTA